MMSLHNDNMQAKDKAMPTTCELEVFYFVETRVATQIEGQDNELKHNNDDLDDVTEMITHNDQKTNQQTSNNTQANEAKLVKFIRPWEELQPIL